MIRSDKNTGSDGQKSMEAVYGALRDADNADQYFIPEAIAEWGKAFRGLKLRVRKGEAHNTRIGGVRLHAYDPSGNNPSLEEQCQYDLSRAIAGLRRVRQLPGFQSSVLAPALSCNPDASGRGGRRIAFGLELPRSKRLSRPEAAAKTCYARIRSAVWLSGLRIESPRSFDPANGLEGLEEWASVIRLRCWFDRRWLLLFLLPLIFIHFCRTAPPPPIDLPIPTSAYVLILDKSGSMEQVITIAQTHIDDLLHQLSRKNSVVPFRKLFLDVIAYDDSAQSALGGITQLTAESRLRIDSFLASLQAGGGTSLQEGLKLAAQEISEHGKPTTIHVITDAQDSSLRAMLSDTNALASSFSGVEVKMYSASPRSLNAVDIDKLPRPGGEADLDVLSRMFGGWFGKENMTP